MSGTSVKSIQKRFYNALPRVNPANASRTRSNSASITPSRSLYTPSLLPSFFDSPPPPPNSSRPTNVIPTKARVLVEGRGEVESGQAYTSNQPSSTTGPPYTLALTSSYHKSQSISPALASSYPFLPTPLVTSGSTAQTASESGPTSRKQKQRFQLDVGAYGIPKNARSGVLPGRQRRTLHTAAPYDDAQLAVGIGEDAYFIRNNAMGVADGVGGWSKSKHAGSSHSTRCSTSSTPSAVFAKHLMHYCSAEIESCTSPHSLPASPPPTPRSSRSPFPTHHPETIPLFNANNDNIPWYWSSPASQESSSFHHKSSYELDLEEQLEDSLEELEDGIDVLMILERAYQKTLDAHVVLPSNIEEFPSPESIPSSDMGLSCSAPSSLSIPTSLNPNPLSQSTTSKKSIPLLAGSSTVLLAVLDHVPRPANGDPEHTHARGLKPSANTRTEYDAVIKVAHVGDCMGMLVRGEQVVWRSEEMWWSFNTPVQLGPSSPATPSSSAHVFTLPVEADDILILASDGLSDNLWDEDILDEVVRFRRNYLKSSSNTSLPSSENSDETNAPKSASERILWRRTLAGLLSEALCSRARRVSERRQNHVISVPIPTSSTNVSGQNSGSGTSTHIQIEDEVPFARRARESGKSFKGGKGDDISVIVAVISPAADLVMMNESGSIES
ncbi:hypothetical protein K435DRAFT_838066 [Dendrothele bispora CBS 962.96]|uniref:Protein phosphatase n=1 Tax=Dendrothele bispora (strain CBS 962.96) TaxID=1314807 RepID=A0A4S8M8L4_DENBC|nr:hypothetical protein K435DRAFT_838066 [Dendrothele bispora CBS 962.96]